MSGRPTQRIARGSIGTLKVEHTPQAIDCGPGKFLEVLNVGSGHLNIAAAPDAGPWLVLAPNENVRLYERAFLSCPTRARVQVAEHAYTPRAEAERIIADSWKKAA